MREAYKTGQQPKKTRGHKMKKSTKSAIEKILTEAPTRDEGTKLKNASTTAGIICNNIAMDSATADFIISEHCEKGGKLETMKAFFSGLSTGKYPETERAEKKSDIARERDEMKAKLQEAGLI